LSEPNLFILRALVAAAQKDDQLIAILAQVNPVSGSEIDLQLYNASAHTAMLAQIAVFNTVDPRKDMRLAELVSQGIDPFPVWNSSRFSPVMEDFPRHDQA
jgi:hypothetical protein